MSYLVDIVFGLLLSILVYIAMGYGYVLRKWEEKMTHERRGSVIRIGIATLVLFIIILVMGYLA